MLNVIFAMGQNGEFGISPEYRKQIMDETHAELRNVPTPGLPWKCRADMLFFRLMTKGIEGDINAYHELSSIFGGESLRAVINSAWSSDFAGLGVNGVISGLTTFLQMECNDSETRRFLPVDSDVIKGFGEFVENVNSLTDVINLVATTPATTWIVGGKRIIEYTLAEHAAGKIKIDNMFVSVIKQNCNADIHLDTDKLTAYIESDFTYNENEHMENDEVLITRFRGK